MKGGASAREVAQSHQAAAGFSGEDVGSRRLKTIESKQSPPQPLLTAQGSAASRSPAALCRQSLFSGILPFLATLRGIS